MKSDAAPNNLSIDLHNQDIDSKTPSSMRYIGSAAEKFTKVVLEQVSTPTTNAIAKQSLNYIIKVIASKNEGTGILPIESYNIIYACGCLLIGI